MAQRAYIPKQASERIDRSWGLVIERCRRSPASSRHANMLEVQGRFEGSSRERNTDARKTITSQKVQVGVHDITTLHMYKVSVRCSYYIVKYIQSNRPVPTHCSKASFFVQKFNFDFPRKLSIFFGVKNS